MKVLVCFGKKDINHDISFDAPQDPLSFSFHHLHQVSLEVVQWATSFPQLIAQHLPLLAFCTHFGGHFPPYLIAQNTYTNVFIWSIGKLHTICVSWKNAFIELRDCWQVNCHKIVNVMQISSFHLASLHFLRIWEKFSSGSHSLIPPIPCWWMIPYINAKRIPWAHIL